MRPIHVVTFLYGLIQATSSVCYAIMVHKQAGIPVVLCLAGVALCTLSVMDYLTFSEGS